jgi:hypothetical protein
MVRRTLINMRVSAGCSQKMYRVRPRGQTECGDVCLRYFFMRSPPLPKATTENYASG